jgi:hypothetical protein
LQEAIYVARRHDADQEYDHKKDQAHDRDGEASLLPYEGRIERLDYSTDRGFKTCGRGRLWLLEKQLIVSFIRASPI